MKAGEIYEGYVQRKVYAIEEVAEKNGMGR